MKSLTLFVGLALLLLSSVDSSAAPIGPASPAPGGSNTFASGSISGLGGSTGTFDTFNSSVTAQVNGNSYYDAPLTSEAVPEPASLVLLGTGLLGVSPKLRRRFSRKQGNRNNARPE